MRFAWGLLHRARRLVDSARQRGEPGGAEDVEPAQLPAVERLLSYYLRGLWDVSARIESGDDPAARRHHSLRRGREPRSRPGVSEDCYTDGITLYLPGTVGVFPRRDDNFAVYRGMAVLCTAQMLYGSLALVRWFVPADEKRLELDLFTMLENSRLEGLLGQEFQGLGEHLRTLGRRCLDQRRTPAGLSDKEALVEELLRYLILRARGDGPSPTMGNGVRRPSVQALLEEMMREIDRRAPRLALDASRLAFDLANGLARIGGPYRGIALVPYWPRIRPERVLAVLSGVGATKGVTHGQGATRQAGEERSATERTRPTGRLGGGIPMRGALPRDLSGAAASPDDESRRRENERQPAIVALETPGRPRDARLVGIGRSNAPADSAVEGREGKSEHGGHVFVYDEWDYRIETYRRGICVLVHEPLPPVVETGTTPDFEPDKGLAWLVRRQFELLRPGRRWQKRQHDGEEIDLESAVEAVADRRASGLSPERLYLARNERVRDVAAALLVDLSASTETWVRGARRVVDVERQALLLMSAALDVLGDSYAIYGFSSKVEKGCAFYRIKGFDEASGASVKARIQSLCGRGYTRMGAPIRHATRILADTEARLKLLIILSDGKPNEVGIYQGKYAVEDTRQAVLEARERRIFPFGVTIDRGDKDYLSRIFGPGGYAVIDDVMALPARMADIYRQLTT